VPSEREGFSYARFRMTGMEGLQTGAALPIIIVCRD
jgi:hypothetical protein